jgi:hypothetical protein
MFIILRTGKDKNDFIKKKISVQGKNLKKCGFKKMSAGEPV